MVRQHGTEQELKTAVTSSQELAGKRKRDNSRKTASALTIFHRVAVESTVLREMDPDRAKANRNRSLSKR